MVSQSSGETALPRHSFLDPVSVTVYGFSFAATIATQLALVNSRISALATAHDETIPVLRDALADVSLLAALALFAFLGASVWVVGQLWMKAQPMGRVAVVFLGASVVGVGVSLGLRIEPAALSLYYLALGITTWALPAYIRLLGRWSGWRVSDRMATLLFGVTLLALVTSFLVNSSAAPAILPFEVLLLEHPVFRDPERAAGADW